MLSLLGVRNILVTPSIDTPSILGVSSMLGASVNACLSLGGRIGTDTVHTVLDVCVLHIKPFVLLVDIESSLILHPREIQAL